MPEALQGSMQGLGSRNLIPEDELLVILEMLSAPVCSHASKSLSQDQHSLRPIGLIGLATLLYINAVQSE